MNRVYKRLALTREFGVTHRQASEIVERLHAGEPDNELLDVFVETAKGREPIAYYAIKELGKGSYGRVYTASLDGAQEPEVVVKRFDYRPAPQPNLRTREDSASPRTRNRSRDPNRSDDDDSVDTQKPTGLGRFLAPLVSLWQTREPDDIDTPVDAAADSTPDNVKSDLEREFRISAAIRRRLGHEFCTTNVVCALKRFYSLPLTRGFIVFPYREVMALNQYLALHIHAPMERLEARAKETKLPLDEITLGVIGTPEAMQLIRDWRLLQLAASQLFLRLLETVSALNSRSIFHSDLNPSNTVVTLDGQLLLIDFGIACVSDWSGDSDYTTRRAQFIHCDKYLTTPDYEDLLARVVETRNETVRLTAFSKFEAYAVAKLGQYIFDRKVPGQNGKSRAYPVVRSTTLMPPGTHRLIVAMTGEDGWHPDVGLGNYVLTLPPDELGVRLAKFANRPSVTNALLTFSSILERWRESSTNN